MAQQVPVQQVGALVAFLVGGLLSVALFEANTVQFVRLVHRRIVLKQSAQIAVVFLWLLEAAQCVMFMYNLFALLLVAPSKPQGIPIWSLIPLLLITIARDTTVRIISTYRIFLWSGRNHLIVLANAFLIFETLVLGIVISFECFTSRQSLLGFAEFSRVVYTYMGSVVLLDGIFAVLHRVYKPEGTSDGLDRPQSFVDALLPNYTIAAVLGWAPLVTLAVMPVPQAIMFLGLHCGLAPLGFLALLTSLLLESQDEADRADRILNPHGRTRSVPQLPEFQVDTPLTTTVFLDAQSSRSSEKDYTPTPTTSPRTPAHTFSSSPMASIRSVHAQRDTFDLRLPPQRHSVHSIHVVPVTDKMGMGMGLGIQTPPPTPSVTTSSSINTARRAKSLNTSPLKIWRRSRELKVRPSSVYDPDLAEDYDHFKPAPIYGSFRLSHV